MKLRPFKDLRNTIGKLREKVDALVDEKDRQRIFNQLILRIAKSEFYDSEEWIVLREKALKRDRYRCRECRIKTATQVHHIIPIWDDPTKAVDLKNLMSVCYTCHNTLEGKVVRRCRGCGNNFAVLKSKAFAEYCSSCFEEVYPVKKQCEKCGKIFRCKKGEYWKVNCGVCYNADRKRY